MSNGFGTFLAILLGVGVVVTFVVAAMQTRDAHAGNHAKAARVHQLKQLEVVTIGTGAIGSVGILIGGSWITSAALGGHQRPDWNIVPTLIVGAVALIIATASWLKSKEVSKKYGITLAE